ncbi:hypothetical protein ACIBCH_09790 [Amycolatopsis thailandensis]|uniref:hypothetical protein n=1 Tax=Amycolatopsis thailandensis TaxID=589330 RepID=UPI0037A7806E
MTDQPDPYTGRHPKDPDPTDPGFCRCGLGLEAWRQACINEVRSQLDTYRSWLGSPDLAHQIDYPAGLDAIEAALQDDQPAEPDLAVQRMNEFADARDQLQARIDKALTLHVEFKIYDDCGHKHTAEDVDAGRAINVADVGYTCADGYEYSICRHCCTRDSGFQSEECAGHVRPCWPCPTRNALTEASPQDVPSVQASGEAAPDEDGWPWCN